jgi:hypothetical protein
VELPTDKEDVQTLRKSVYHSIFISGAPYFREELVTALVAEDFPIEEIGVDA